MSTQEKNRESNQKNIEEQNREQQGNDSGKENRGGISQGQAAGSPDRKEARSKNRQNPTWQTGQDRLDKQRRQPEGNRETNPEEQQRNEERLAPGRNDQPQESDPNNPNRME